ncbi:MAG: A24 family peptidase [Peptostreptococcales bacterium]
MFYFYIAIFIIGLLTGRLLKVFLKSRHRHNKPVIFLQYPFIEGITGVLFLLLLTRWGYSFEFFAMCLLASLLIITFFMDFYYKIIPNEVVIVGIGAGIIIQIYSGVTGHYGFYSGRMDGFLAALVACLLLVLIYIFSLLLFKGKEGIGMGDIKLYIPIGLFLGLKLTLLSLWIAMLSAGMLSMALLLKKKVNRTSSIPFGPFIVWGIFAGLFL